VQHQPGNLAADGQRVGAGDRRPHRRSGDQPAAKAAPANNMATNSSPLPKHRREEPVLPLPIRSRTTLMNHKKAIPANGTKFSATASVACTSSGTGSRVRSAGASRRTTWYARTGSAATLCDRNGLAVADQHDIDATIGSSTATNLAHRVPMAAEGVDDDLLELLQAEPGEVAERALTTETPPDMGQGPS
jgi:hypothetical protein